MEKSAPLHITDPHQFMYEQTVAQSNALESRIRVSDNWDRVIREEPRQMVHPPQAALIRAGKSQAVVEETDGEKVMRLWKLNGRSDFL